MKRLLVIVPALAMSAAAHTQTPAPPLGVDPSMILAPRPAEGSGATAAPDVSAAPTIPERARDAIRLPDLADGLREDGVPVPDVRRAIDSLREGGADAVVAADVLEAEGVAVRARGPVGFGDFVRTRLAEGLRGRVDER